MIGQTVSRYTILEHIGGGGMGVVYKAEDTRLKRAVALKFLPPELTQDTDAKERFVHEAQAASGLHHNNICVVHDIEETDDGQMFICMEYIDGEPLTKKISGRAMGIDEAVDIASQVAQALSKAHGHGIIHRDIKPANVLVSTDGVAKIVDFGLAKLRGRTALTRKGSTVGTAGYMSPEQAQGHEVDERTDIWSLGIVLYEMLTGHLPFRGDYEVAQLYSIVHEDPTPLESYRQDVPPALARLIVTCLKKDRDQRYQRVQELVADLRRIHPDRPIGPRARVRTPISRWLVLAAASVATAIGIYFFMTSMPPGGNKSKTVAVLPFENFSENADDEYFSDGITDDVLAQLYLIGDLKVISRTTMKQYKDTKKTIREIGRELNADAVLEGSVRKAGNRLRIVVQLIDAGTDDHLWAENYDRELNDVFAVQSEIALRIADALHTTLSTSERDRLEAPLGVNAEAYNLLLQGNHIAARGTREDVAAAIEKFKAALSLDSSYAIAWARLATAYARQADIGAVSTVEGYANARQAAERALELDPQLAEGYTIMGWIRRSYDWDWTAAEMDCRKALALAPGDVTVIRSMANMEKSLGKFEEALVLIKKASELDPLRASVFSSLGFFSMYANRLDEAAAAYQRAIELTPDYPPAHTFLGLVYLLQGDPDRAIAEIRKENDEGWRLFGLAQALHSASRKMEADSALRSLIADYGAESAYQVAEVYAYRGEKDSAFEWLERAYAARDGGLSEIKGDPFMRSIESDRRYRPFLQRLGLPP